jgi:tRNA-specific 2-thiouridylase
MSDSPIVVALSGGVDSATAAAMLVEAGHRVVGITMRLYDASGTTAAVGRCCGPRDIEDARRVCHHLGIPFYVVDFESEFASAVVDDFVDAYLAGETPNPCVTCNQQIKFTPLLRRARALGAEVVATGHYAQIVRTDRGWQLRRGRDPGKDQSYFLFSMPADELAAVRFPLGDLTKEEVRDRAAGFGLPNASKAESQEICFVPDGDYAGFVAASALARGRSVPPPGEIVDGAGTILGEHRGIHHYTVGQRRGFGGVSVDGKPVYVTAIDPASNRIQVGPRADAASAGLSVRDVQWLIDRPTGGLRALVQVRHRARPVPATVTATATGARVVFDGDPVVAAPGQAAVFYDGDAVLGGGWITTTTA